jgi:ferrochelatase
VTPVTAPPVLRPPADGAVSVLPDTFFDAILVVSFGGPEGMDDVLPFLENVTRGRNVPRERLEEVALHYAAFGGVSPINGQNRALIAALRTELDVHQIDLPIYFGNRNWHPLLPDTIREMAADGIQRALAFFTSGFSCYSGCRQYRENVWVAQELVGPDAPEVLKTRMFYNHPGFVEAAADLVGRALAALPADRRGRAPVLFTAHSIPEAMARHSRYEVQLAESARLIAERAGVGRHEVVYQSRSGSPGMPWLEPDVCDRLRELAREGVTEVVVAPLGFVSDHIEVLYDLDDEAQSVAAELGVTMVRAATVGTHPRFVSAIRELIAERLDPTAARPALGSDGPGPDVCARGCCLPGTGRPSPWDTAG